jgi:xyloglucan-specific endo-beta-1,4-glucanase
MKFSALSAAASLACLAIGAPTRTIEKRADMCGQWDSAVTGSYTLYQVQQLRGIFRLYTY